MDAEIPGFVTPVHRALTEPILMGGAPRSIAIVNGTLAAALGIGLRLWIAGLKKHAANSKYGLLLTHVSSTDGSNGY